MAVCASNKPYRLVDLHFCEGATDDACAPLLRKPSLLTCSSLRHQKESHLDEAHPYTPFPIDRLEQAVASVPSDTYSPEEQELNRFGESYSFTWSASCQWYIKCSLVQFSRRSAKRMFLVALHAPWCTFHASSGGNTSRSDLAMSTQVASEMAADAWTCFTALCAVCNWSDRIAVTLRHALSLF